MKYNKSYVNFIAFNEVRPLHFNSVHLSTTVYVKITLKILLEILQQK